MTKATSNLHERMLSMFRAVGEDALLLTVAIGPCEKDIAFHDMAIRFCPFCGVPLQSRKAPTLPGATAPDPAALKIIQVRVSGCVRTPGPRYLREPATVRAAVAAAGGFGTPEMQPTGVVSVRSRRKSDGGYYRRRTLDFRREPAHLEVPVRSQDLVIVQFDTRTHPRWTSS